VASTKNDLQAHGLEQQYAANCLVDTQAANATNKAPQLFHFGFSFVKSDVGKPV
jgi:hypothetical protein